MKLLIDGNIMTPAKARSITKKSCAYAIAGVVIGLLLSSSQGNQIIPICGYVFWAGFHGVQIAKPIYDFLNRFGPVHLETKGIFELYYQSFLLNIFTIILKLTIGLLIGIIGGAIIRQIYLIWVVY